MDSELDILKIGILVSALMYILYCMLLITLARVEIFKREWL